MGRKKLPPSAGPAYALSRPQEEAITEPGQVSSSEIDH